MIISHKYKFIYIAIGKTGCGTAKKFFQKYDEGIGFNNQERRLYHVHAPALHVKNKLNDDIWNSYFKFAFVRNPWDWIVSCLFWNRIVKRNTEKITVQDIDNFIEHQKKFTRGVTWKPYKTQIGVICDENGELLVDYVARFENMQEEWNKICDKVGIPRENLSIEHKSHHKHYREHYTEETREKVKELWQEDITTFNYEF